MTFAALLGSATTAAAQSDGLNVPEIVIGMLGGLAIFLFGMEMMTDALKSVAGAGMSRVLERLTRNRFTSAITGAFVTAVIQSSSVTTVLVVGFITSGSGVAASAPEGGSTCGMGGGGLNLPVRTISST